MNDDRVYTTADTLWILNASSKVFNRLFQRLSTASLLLRLVLAFVFVVGPLSYTASFIMFSASDDKNNDSFSKAAVATLSSLRLLIVDEDMSGILASSSSLVLMTCIVESSSAENEGNTILLFVGVDDKCRVCAVQTGWMNADVVVAVQATATTK